jgi:hypothetical protein
VIRRRRSPNIGRKQGLIETDEARAARSRRSSMNWESAMATGLYVMPHGMVMVAYGTRKIPISCAKYKANGYKPPLEKLAASLRTADRPRAPEADRRRQKH